MLQKLITANMIVIAMDNIPNTLETNFCMTLVYMDTWITLRND